MSDLYYAPWDPLQLAPLGETFLPVNSHIKMYQGYRFKKTWYAGLNNNFLFVAGYREVLDKFTRYSRLFKRRGDKNVSVHYYSFRDDVELVEYSRHPYMVYHRYDESFEHFMNELDSYMRGIRVENKKRGWSENKTLPLQFVLFPVDSEANELLSYEKKYWRILKETTRHIGNRLVVIPVIEEIGALPQEFFNIIKTVFYVTPESRNLIANVFYPDYRIAKNSWYRDTTCYYINERYNVIHPLYDVGNEVNEWGKNHRKKLKEEKEAYQAFLDGLN